MTRRRHILPALSATLLAGILVSQAHAFQGMGGQGAPPAGHGAAATAAPSAAAVTDAVPSPDPSDAIELPPVVLKVDGKEFSSALFRLYVRDILGQRPLKKADFFPLLNQMALDVAASSDVLKEMPALEKDPVVVHELSTVRARVLPRVFFASEIEGKVKPTDEQLLAKAPPFYPIFEVTVISTDRYGDTGDAGLPAALAKIELAEKALASGVPFEQVASDRKYNDAISSRDGKIFKVSEGSLSPFNAEEFARFSSLKAGQVTPVFPTRLGYAIARVEKVTSVEEQRRDALERNRAIWTAALYREEYDRRFAEISERSKVEWNDAALGRLRSAIDNRASLVPFMDDELVKVNGTGILAREIVSLSFNHGGNVFDIYLDKRVRSEVVAQEAERLGLAGTYGPLLDLAFRRAVTRRYIDVHREGIKAGEAELRAWYGKNLDRFRYEESRRLRIVETSSEKTAKDVAKKGRKGKDFEALAEKHNDHPKSREAKGNAGFLQRKNLPAEYAEAVFSAKAGDVLGPFEGKHRETGKPVWSVLKVEEVVPAGVRPFESLKREVLVDRYLSNTMEEFHKGFLDGVNQRHATEYLLNPDGGRGNEEKQS